MQDFEQFRELPVNEIPGLAFEATRIIFKHDLDRGGEHSPNLSAGIGEAAVHGSGEEIFSSPPDTTQLEVERMMGEGGADPDRN